MTVRMLAVAAVALAVFAAAPAQAQQYLRPGDQVEGRLQRGDDRLDAGEFVDVYEFRGRAGDRVSVRMTSHDFDAYLMIRGPGDFAEDNDDSGHGDETDSLLEIRLPADGVYQISATSYEPSETGDYVLSLHGQDRGGRERAGPGGRGGDHGGRGDDLYARGGPLAPDQTLQGWLSPGDHRLQDGEYADGWVGSVQRGQRYALSLRSGDFDAYLVLRGAGLEVDNDDDESARGSTDSRLVFTAPESGEITVTATSYAADETGPYSIRLERLGGRGPDRDGRGPQQWGGGQGELRLGQSVQGALMQGDRRLDGGEYVDTFLYRGRRGEQLDLGLSSSEFDAYVAIEGPNGFSAFNDDDPSGDGGRDSRLLVTLPSDGEYRVHATSYAAGETGAFRLSARPGRGQSQEPSWYADRGGSGGPGDIDIGDTVGGFLAAGDDTLDSGEYVDRYVFTGRRGQRIAAELTSSAFDAYIILSTPSGETLDNDDGEDGTNSRLDTVLTEDGEYEVMVTSFAPGETGSYRFSVTPSQGSPRQAAVQGGARVFAVMVGVSDYGSEEANLPYTDEDARKLAETLRREGVLNPASVVLTNAQATVGGVRRAFQQVARQAGPDDMFLFFFSGHGGQEEGGREPDGRYETITLRDGEITDTEMASMFGTLRTRLSMLVLDSCFSGGFARNVVDRPGVMGLFSSEEDLTSAVADKFEAGGYLAHFLRSGLAGEADGDGDAMVTAGELSTYLRRRFTRDAEDIDAETIDGQRNYQNLVVDRGGVQVDDVVIRLASSGSSFGAH